MLHDRRAMLKNELAAVETAQIAAVSITPLRSPSLTFTLAKADPPSLIGAAFHSVREAIRNHIHVQILSTEADLRALGVEIEG